ncbi:uncharacterized protein UHOD_08775 [Ustilago sp. UG-2017b]|nr:uncharacterized protein UHOD_08775 [Ustilago sp. UG-2017b]
MRHKRLLSSAADACGHHYHHHHRQARRPRSIARANVVNPNVAGPSSLPAPSPPPPPIHASRFTLPPTVPASSSSTFSPQSFLSPSAPVPQPLSFLYPPSCLDLACSSSSLAVRQGTALRSKSSLAPTRAVSVAAQQLAPVHQDNSHHRKHLPYHLEPNFTFLRHHYNPPHPLIDHPPSNALLQQDANSHLEEERISHPPAFDPLTADDTTIIPPTSRPKPSAASVAELASLRQQSSNLRKAIQKGAEIQPATVVKGCRRLVLLFCRIHSRLRARTARAIFYETLADGALYLSASGQAISAATVLRHFLVKLGWNPRSISHLELPLLSTTANQFSPTSNVEPSLAAVASNAAARLALIAQQVISQLTLAPSPSSARPSRRFDSHQHLDTATSLLSAMHLAHMPRSTPSQTALVRAMIASAHTPLAVQTYAAEVRAWWMAHKEARRPRSPIRRQAALVVEMGKPSSQALREITRALQQIEELLSRIQPDLLSQLSDHERQALSAKRIKYADSLVELIRLVRGGRLPLPPTPSAPEIAWILSACCRFESTMLLNESSAADATKSKSRSFDAAERQRLVGAAQVIRYYLREYMQSLPDGETRSAGQLLIGGNPVIRPAIGVAVYNQLIHYALSVLKSPSICKEVFQHMTQTRQPPLEPDAVTFNTILRQATTQRYESLARAVLTTKRSEQSQIHAGPKPSSASTQFESSAASASVAAIEVEACPFRPMIDQIDTAIAHADSYRLVSLLQYVTASGLFLRRFRHEPGHAGVKEIVMRIYPALNTHSYARGRAPRQLSDGQQLSSSSADRPLRPKANQASRHAILDPHVLTATLNLAVKAGKTGLALRIWRLIKRTSLQSALQSPSIDVARRPWKVPMEAATLLMQVLANEAARMPTVRHAVRTQRMRPACVGARRPSNSMGRSREYARGFNIVASLRPRRYAGRSHNSVGDLGEGLRWRAAQVLAKREYAFLVHHWGLLQKFGRWRRKRLEAWLQSDPSKDSESAPSVRSKQREEEISDIDQGMKPDSRFFDALLGVLGRRSGMIQRSKSHVSRSEILSQLRRGYKDAAKKAGVGVQASSSKDQAATVASSQDNLASLTGASSATTPAHAEQKHNLDTTTVSTSQLLHLIISRIHWNSRGRSTAHSPDPFLVRILLDMEALALSIPVGFRWILTHCALHSAEAEGVPELLQNEEARNGARGRKSAFSPWRGPRIKTVGMIVRRLNTARLKDGVEEETKRGSTK